VERIAALGSPLVWIDTLHRRVQAVRYLDVPFSGSSAAVQASQVPIDTLNPALDNIASDCPLILSQIIARGEFAGKQSVG